MRQKSNAAADLKAGCIVVQNDAEPAVELLYGFEENGELTIPERLNTCSNSTSGALHAFRLQHACDAEELPYRRVFVCITEEKFTARCDHCSGALIVPKFSLEETKQFA